MAARAVPPPILTARLALRPYEPEDAEEAHASLFSDPEVMRHVGGPLTPRQVSAQIERAIGWQDDLGHSFWPVFERETGLLVGEAGIVPINATGPGLEVGYAFARPAWGQGYATEVGEALLAEAFTTLRADEVVAHVREENAASRRVLEKLGFRPAGTATAWGSEQLRLVRAAH